MTPPACCVWAVSFGLASAPVDPVSESRASAVTAMTPRCWPTSPMLVKWSFESTETTVTYVSLRPAPSRSAEWPHADREPDREGRGNHHPDHPQPAREAQRPVA